MLQENHNKKNSICVNHTTTSVNFLGRNAIKPNDGATWLHRKILNFYALSSFKVMPGHEWFVTGLSPQRKESAVISACSLFWIMCHWKLSPPLFQLFSARMIPPMFHIHISFIPHRRNCKRH